ncbi:uncharacterized protein LOC112601918 [Melanaphis sacchari]|uniref:uncharacterized protein LOC112601918 n=1 Tax=Melanaphis sacchari TaxID=742174 RepID=UPI000DC13F11|nr:uncharacterized protein LOC112601918 [Melanaphis sacchari]
MNIFYYTSKEEQPEVANFFRRCQGRTADACVVSRSTVYCTGFVRNTKLYLLVLKKRLVSEVLQILNFDPLENVIVVKNLSSILTISSAKWSEGSIVFMTRENFPLVHIFKRHCEKNLITGGQNHQ